MMRRNWTRALVCCTALAAWGLAPPAASADPIAIAEVTRDTPVDFETEVLPLFKRSCIACHNAATAESHLSLETPQSIRKGGDSGPAVEPKDSAASILLSVASHNSEPVMPPKDNKVNAKPLTPAELGLVKLWIDQGAEGMVSGKNAVLNWQPLPPGVNPIYAVAMTPDGQFAVAGRANQVFVYHLPSGAEVCRLTDPALVSGGPYNNPGVAHLDIVQALAMNPQGDLLASGGYREVKLWRRPTNVQQFKFASAGVVTALAVSPDKSLLATGSDDNTIQLHNTATGQAGATLSGHTGSVTSLRFSADGTQLISGSADKSIRVWSVPAGQPLARIDTPAAVSAVTIAGAMGQFVASAGAMENNIRLWTLPTEPAKQLAELPTPVTALAASADKKWLAIAGGDGKVALVDVATGKAASTLAAHEGAVSSVSFNLSNNRLVTSGADKRVRVWDIATAMPVAELQPGLATTDNVALNPAGTQAAAAWGEGVAAVFKLDAPAARPLNGENGAAATVMATSPNGALVAVDGVSDGKPAIFVREVASGNVTKTIVGHEGAITALAFSADNSRLASGSADKTARVWNLADGAQLASFALHTAGVTGVAFNSNGQQVVSGSADNSLKLWNVADAAEIKNFAGHAGAISGVAMFSNDQFILSASADQTVKVWNPADGAEVRSLAAGAAATALALSRDNARVAVAAGDNSIKIFQVADGALQLTLAGHAAPAKSLQFSADGQRLVSGGAEKHALAWETAKGRLIEAIAAPAGLAAVAYGADPITVLVASADKSLTVQSLHFERGFEGLAMKITGVAYSNDGGAVFVSSLDGTIRGFGAGDAAQRFSANHGAPVNGLAISADGQWLASAGDDKFVRVWNAGNGAAGPKPQLGPLDSVAKSVCFSRDNKQLLAGTAESGLVAFDLATGLASQAYADSKSPALALAAVGETSPLWIAATGDNVVKLHPFLAVREIAGHTGPVSALISSPINPALILSGSADGTVREWNVDNGQMTRQFAHGGPVTSVAMRADGKRVASGGTNNLARLFNAENNQPLAELKGDMRLQNALAKAVKAFQVGTALVNTKKAALDAAQKDIPVKVEAAKKTAEALAATTKDFEEKTAAFKTASDAKAVADKASVDAAAAVKVAEDAAAKAKTALDADALNQTLIDAKAAADKALEAAKKAAQDAAAAATAAAKPADDANAALKAAESANNSAKKANDEADQNVKKANELVPATMTQLASAEEAVKVLEAAQMAATAAATAGEKPVGAVAFSPDGAQVVTGGEDTIVHSFNAETGAPLELYQGHAAPIDGLTFIDNNKLASASLDKNAVVWDVLPVWTLERTIGGLDSPLFADRVIALKFSPDGQLLATGGGEPSRSGEVKLFNVADGNLVRDIADAHSDTVFGLDFSSDGKYLASCAADKFVKVFDVATGEKVKSFEGHTHHVLGVAFRWDGTRLMSCGADNAVKVWNFETGDQVATIAGYAKQATSISFIGDSVNTISSGGDGTVRMHNSDNNQNFRNFAGAADYMFSAASSPDGKLIIAGGQDSILRVWNGENAQALKQFDPPKDEEATPEAAAPAAAN
ncbi:MAG: c-type cytochrome domain-containing protein [Pirellulales bacterium]